MYEIDEETRLALYSWIDRIPIDRKKQRLQRDFSDGVLVAEIIHHYLPRYVELHNYPPANKTEKKEVNWQLLNRRVFKKLGFELHSDIIKHLASADKETIEYFLLMLKDKIEVEKMMASPRNKRRITKDNQSFTQSVESNGKSPRHAGSISYRSNYDQTDLGLIRTYSLLDLYSFGRDFQIPVRPQRVIKTISESDNVPKILYEEKEKESQELDRKIETIENEIQKLEMKLKLKESRIKSAEENIQRLEPFASRKFRGYVPQQKQ